MAAPSASTCAVSPGTGGRWGCGYARVMLIGVNVLDQRSPHGPWLTPPGARPPRRSWRRSIPLVVWATMNELSDDASSITLICSASSRAAADERMRIERNGAQVITLLENCILPDEVDRHHRRKRGLAGLNQSGELHVVQQDGPRHLINRIAARRAALDFGASVLR